MYLTSGKCYYKCDEDFMTNPSYTECIPKPVSMIPRLNKYKSNYYPVPCTISMAALFIILLIIKKLYPETDLSTTVSAFMSLLEYGTWVYLILIAYL